MTTATIDQVTTPCSYGCHPDPEKRPEFCPECNDQPACDFPTGDPHPAGLDAVQVKVHGWNQSPWCGVITLCRECYEAGGEEVPADYAGEVLPAADAEGREILCCDFCHVSLWHTVTGGCCVCHQAERDGRTIEHIGYQPGETVVIAEGC